MARMVQLLLVARALRYAVTLRRLQAMHALEAAQSREILGRL